MAKQYRSGMVIEVAGQRFAIRHWCAYHKSRVYVQSEWLHQGYHMGWKDAGYVDILTGESHITRGRCKDVKRLVADIMDIDYGDYSIDIPDAPRNTPKPAPVSFKLFS